VTVVAEIWDDEIRTCKVGPEAPVPILQWQWEFQAVLDLYEERKPMKVVEVGTYHGGTLYHWLSKATPGATVISIDSYVTGVDNSGMYQDWCPTDVELIAIRGDSRKVWIDQGHLLRDTDWLFIDAGHTFNEVLDDWQSYSQFVAPNGVVLLHDIVPGGEQHPELEVHQLWRQIQAKGYVTQEVISDHVADWGGIGIVYL
jgi:predicted O-methyltransferase YrrM